MNESSRQELDPNRLDNLFILGVDEISYRKHHNYLTLVTNHETGKIVYGAEGKSANSLDEFFDDLGEERIAKIKAATMDLGPAFAKAFREKAPNAQICLDPFHVVKVRHEAPCIPAEMKGHRLGDVAASQRS